MDKRIMKPIQKEGLIVGKLEGIFNLLSKRQVELGSCSNDFICHLQHKKWANPVLSFL